MVADFENSSALMRLWVWCGLIVILNKRSLPSEGSGRAARCVAFFATQ